MSGFLLIVVFVSIIGQVPFLITLGGDGGGGGSSVVPGRGEPPFSVVVVVIGLVINFNLYLVDCISFLGEEC